MSNKENELLESLEIKAKLNNFNYIDYCESHIRVINNQFDSSWQAIHGYHPIEAADWEKGFNGADTNG